MKKFLAVLALVVAMTLAPQAGKAQSNLGPIPVPENVRVLGGVTGGDLLGNTFAGLNVSLEIPFKTRYEIDLSESFEPFYSHISLGTGIANQGEVDGILWLGRGLGFTGGYESSIYSVPTLTKSYLYANGGLIYRHTMLGHPTRFRLLYFQEVNNGVTNGLETDQVKAAEISVDTRIGCFGAVCVRLGEKLFYGSALTQGNPTCDGSTPGIADTCPRSTVLSSGAEGSIRFEFPRKNSSKLF